MDGLDDLEDELDIRYHKGLEPDCYYRVPSLESLDAALRNEIQKSTESLIPVDVITEFVFGITSTITIPASLQPNLDALFQPADYPQSITVDYALCRDLEGKKRLKLQKTIARCFIEAIQEIDGFRYSERHIVNKEGKESSRFKYVCVDSLQNRNRKLNLKEEKSGEKSEGGSQRKSRGNPELPTFDCGGAIHIKFSIKREAINIVYKHNPIHRDIDSRPTNDYLAALVTDVAGTHGTSLENKQKKRKRSRKGQAEVDLDSDNVQDDIATSSAPTRNKAKNSTVPPVSTRAPSVKEKKKAKQAQSPPKGRKKAPADDLTRPAVQPVSGKCLRCREKGIKCNEAKPTCNQCRRGLWTCQYAVISPKKRSRNGCQNCKLRKRKCTEGRPSCTYCLKVGDDCIYQEFA